MRKELIIANKLCIMAHDLLTTENIVSWIKPSLSEEKGELERVATELGFDYQDLESSYHNGRFIYLTNDIWFNLSNTESWNPNLTEEQALQYAEEYGKNIDSIFDAVDNGGTLPAPTIMRLNDGTWTLVGGNTRLMVARVRGITPKVWAFDAPT